MGNPETKGAARKLPRELDELDERSSRGRAGGFLCLGRHWPRVLALLGRIAIDEFDYRHGRGVAVPEARLHDADITALALAEALGQHVEELLHLRLVANFSHGEAARMEPALLGERHQL